MHRPIVVRSMNHCYTVLEVFVFRAHEPVERRFGACNDLLRRIATLGKDVRLGVELAFGSALLPEHTAI